MASDSKKRKGDSLNDIPIPLFTSEWVTPSKTRNAVLNDYILDWLNLYGESKGFIPDTKQDTYDPETDFGKYIMEQGNKFETYIAEELRKKFSFNFVQVKTIDNYKRTKDTIDLMSKGCPIIYQGMIYNPKLKVYGIPDLIIRSDFINKITSTKTVSDNQKGCKFNNSWHYRIIDIKFHTLHLKSNFTTICNDNSVRAFKVQCYLYNQCLEYIQKFLPTKSYILGRGWNATNKNTEYLSNFPFNKLGVIDFSNEDFGICEDSLLAVKWYSRVKSEGKSWSILPQPSIPELYPNMKIVSYKWKSAKYELAKKLEELTLVYNVGYYNRIYSHLTGVYKISDPNCNSRSLDISGKKNSQLVDGILEGYKNSGKLDRSSFELSSNRLSGFFIDIENISSIHNIRDNTDNRIYMIGVGFFDLNNKWNYTCFVAKSLDKESENKMFIEFYEYISKFSDNVIYHYNSTDKNELYKLAYRLPTNIYNQWMAKYVFCDIYNSLKNGIFIKGCLNFSLKNISKALGCNRYDDLEIRSGSESIIWGIRYYEKCNNNATASYNDWEIYLNNIKKYNEIDCIALSDVVRYLNISVLGK